MLQHYHCVVMTSLGAKQVVAQVVAALLVNRIVPTEEPDDVERQRLNLFPIWVRVIPVSKDWTIVVGSQGVSGSGLQADESGVVGLPVFLTERGRLDEPL